MDLNRFRKAHLFNDNGKWKYDVWLDYTDVDYGTWDLWTQARKAFKQSTEKGTSGVTFEEIPEGWMLVIPDPISEFEYPIMVKGIPTRVNEDPCNIKLIDQESASHHECKSIKYHISSVHTCKCGYTWGDEEGWRDREMKKAVEDNG